MPPEIEELHQRLTEILGSDDGPVIRIDFSREKLELLVQTLSKESTCPTPSK